MKFILSWLKDHLDTTASLQQITDTLTAIGLEVEKVSDRAAALQAFTAAKILATEPHPGADKLRVCQVQSDIGTLQIVCGAPNARAGISVALAKEGATIPNGSMVIKKTKIRGVESNGMLCSYSELGLSGDSDGIIELPENATIGDSIVSILGLDDPLIEIAITPNRADCLGVRGIARDLAAAGLGSLKPVSSFGLTKGSHAADGDPSVKPKDDAVNRFASLITLTITDTATCPQFIGCFIKGVKNGPSPDWLKKRLEAIGQRSISALVDITNYFTFDLGRPLHVFDASKIVCNLTVRDAKEGETLKALNGKDYILQPGMTVIADDASVLALGGIIGGEPSSCSESTTDVFVEIALFDPVSIAQTGRTLSIDSDARYRFERGVDVDFVENAAHLAVAKIIELCGGEASELTFAGKTPEWQRSFNLHYSRVASMGGITLPRDKVEAIFHALGFVCVSSGESWTVSPPSWRGDIQGESDLVEEVLRIHGYDHIPATSLPKLAHINKPALTLMQKRAHLAKRTLANRGILEICSWSFISEGSAKYFGEIKPALKLLNPISAELDTMRPNLLPNLLEAVSKNTARGYRDIALFEAGLQFHSIAPDGQRLVAAAIHSGIIKEQNTENNGFQQRERPVDAFDARNDALAVLQTLGIARCDITAHTPPWYHPGRSGSLTLGGKVILGYFGELHPQLLRDFNIENIIVACELFLDAIPVSRTKTRAKPSLKLSGFQAVERDFAFIVNESVTAAEITKAILQADKQLITNVAIFDVYTGTGVSDLKKSVAIKVTLQAIDRTLSEQDIATVSAAIITAAEKGFGGTLRQ